MKVNTKTLIATRESPPMALIGLSAETLRNLQTELNPVPTEFKDIEFWDEVDTTPTYNSDTHTYDGTEVLTADATTKTVNVVRGVRLKTDAELLVQFKATVPVSISMRQARQALLASGLLATIDAAIASGPDESLKIDWEYAVECRRDWTSLIAMASSLNLSEVQLDNLFIEGSKI